MTTVPLVTRMAGLLALIALAVLLIVPRRLAARNAQPITVLVSGQVPAAVDWLPPALTAFATGHRAQTSWTDVEEHGVLVGHRGTVDLPAGELAFTAELRPHPLAAAVPPDHPLRVKVGLSGGAAAAGIGRLILGQRPTTKTLDQRDELWSEISQRALDAGAMVRGGLPGRGIGVARAAALVLVLAAVAAPVPYAIDVAAAWFGSEPPPTPRALPSGASACPSSGPSGSSASPAPPTLAVHRTSCATAEKVRAEYQKKKPAEVIKVTVPTSRGKLTFRCTMADRWVACRDDKRIAYF